MGLHNVNETRSRELITEAIEAVELQTRERITPWLRWGAILVFGVAFLLAEIALIQRQSTLERKLDQTQTQLRQADRNIGTLQEQLDRQTELIGALQLQVIRLGEDPVTRDFPNPDRFPPPNGANGDSGNAPITPQSRSPPRGNGTANSIPNGSNGIPNGKGSNQECFLDVTLLGTRIRAFCTAKGETNESARRSIKASNRHRGGLTQERPIVGGIGNRGNTQRSADRGSQSRMDSSRVGRANRRVVNCTRGDLCNLGSDEKGGLVSRVNPRRSAKSGITEGAGIASD